MYKFLKYLAVSSLSCMMFLMLAQAETTVTPSVSEVTVTSTDNEFYFDIKVDTTIDFNGVDFGLEVSNSDVKYQRMELLNEFKNPTTKTGTTKENIRYEGFFNADHELSAGEYTIARVYYTYEGTTDATVSLAKFSVFGKDDTGKGVETDDTFNEMVVNINYESSNTGDTGDTGDNGNNGDNGSSGNSGGGSSNVEIEDTETPLSDGSHLQFTDIVGHWAYDNIVYTLENNLFNGVSDTKFEPDSSMTRAMVVTVLHRVADEVEPQTKATFDDVLVGSWYETAVDWASENNIVNGVSETSFAPNQNITREQFVTILWRYEKEPTYEMDLSKYTDVSEVDSYAVEAFKWAISEGIITGKTEETLAPNETATRAEIATMLTRYLKK